MVYNGEWPARGEFNLIYSKLILQNRKKTKCFLSGIPSFNVCLRFALQLKSNNINAANSIYPSVRWKNVKLEIEQCVNVAPIHNFIEGKQNPRNSNFAFSIDLHHIDSQPKKRQHEFIFIYNTDTHNTTM